MKFKCPACNKVFKAKISNQTIRQLPRCPGKLFRKCNAMVDESDEYVGRFKRAWRWVWTKKPKASEPFDLIDEATKVHYKAFDGHITIDPVKGEAGTSFPVGTVGYPVNNLEDAQKISVCLGLPVKPYCDFENGNCLIPRGTYCECNLPGVRPVAEPDYTPDFVDTVRGVYTHLLDSLDEPENMEYEIPQWLIDMCAWREQHVPALKSDPPIPIGNEIGMMIRGRQVLGQAITGALPRSEIDRLNRINQEGDIPERESQWKGVKVRFPGMTEDAAVATDGTTLRIRGLNFQPIETEMKPAGPGCDPFDFVGSVLENPTTVAVRTLLSNARTNLEKNPETMGYLIAAHTKRQFLIEFKTIKVSGPRQSGNTTAAVQIANDLGPDYLFVTCNLGLKRHAWQMGLEENRVFSCQEVLEHKTRGRKYNHLIVDGMSCMRPNEIENLVREVEPGLTHESWVIMLG